MRFTLLLLTFTTTASAQWQLQQSNTTASLRGIHDVTPQIAWASGTEGTILRTEDGGQTWQHCTTPPNAEKLDFRGIQAFDNKTAIAMSSGKGDLSRLYKTTDGCKTWKLIATNPDADGFWDAISSDVSPDDITILGDPVSGRFVLRTTGDGGKTWADFRSAPILPDEAAYAASNSSMFDHSSSEDDGPILFVTGGPQGSRLFHAEYSDACMKKPTCAPVFVATEVPFFPKADSAGIFSIEEGPNYTVVAVGGDYLKPNTPAGTAAYLAGKHWHAATTTPHGYRSAVAYDPTTKSWLTVGPNGTDISTDDGRNWRPLKPLPTDTPDADQHWNALSLPFAVGPKGRIGKLEPTALKPTTTNP